MIVIQSVAERFQELLKKTASSFETGSGVSERIIQSAMDKLLGAKEKGAQFLVGGQKLASRSALMPTILTGVTKDMDIKDEESFGPTLCLYIAKNDREAIDIANETRYGLNAAVHSTNMQHALDKFPDFPIKNESMAVHGCA